MIQGVHEKLRPGLPWKSSIQQEDDSLHQQIRFRAKEEISEVLHLEHSFVWCGNLDSSETRSEVPGKF
jgi:hypothetical protein